MSSKKHILIVDDEFAFLKPLAAYFEKQGFKVSEAQTAREAIRKVNSVRPDIILLDLTLPDGDGLDVCKTIRTSFDTPIIFLSGRVDTTDKVVALELGGDDYVTKPCEPRELLARVRSTLRRYGGILSDQKHFETPKSIIKFGPWSLDPQAQLIFDTKSGNKVHLTGGELRILLMLIRYPGVVLSRDKLLDLKQEDGTPEVFDRTIDNFISRLRKKIEPSKDSKRLIKTYWGGGYSLDCDVEYIPR